MIKDIKSLDCNLFKSNKNNHVLITGAPGTGKSVLTKSLIMNARENHCMVRVIDSGSSYKKVVEHLHGQSMTWQDQHQYCLNPFGGIKERSEFKGILQTFTVLVMQMMYDFYDNEIDALFEDKAVNRPFEFHMISMAIEKVWDEKGAAMTFFDLIESLKGMENSPAALDLAMQLHDLVEVLGANWLTGECELDLANPLMLFDVQNISGATEQENYAVIFLLTRILYDFSLKTEKELAETGEMSKKYIIIDEGWTLLQHRKIANFIEAVVRIAPQFNASLIIVAQGINEDINDFVESSIPHKLVKHMNFIVALDDQGEAFKNQSA